jgi:hypothetical protein
MRTGRMNTIAGRNLEETSDSPSAGSGALRGPAERRHARNESLRVQRFYHVILKAGGERFGAVFRACKRGQRMAGSASAV